MKKGVRHSVEIATLDIHLVSLGNYYGKVCTTCRTVLRT